MIWVLHKFLLITGFHSFRIPLLGLGIFIATCLEAGAQHNNELVVKGCTLSIQNGADLIVRGDLRIEGAAAQLRNNGFLELQGNMYSDTLFQQRGTGTTRFHNRSVNTTSSQFIQGSCNVRGGSSQIGVNDGSFYSLELANSQGIVWLNGTGNVADVRNSVDFAPVGTGTPINRIITHNPSALPSRGSAYSAVFGMMNSTAGLGNFINNSVTLNGNSTAIDNGYIQGKLRRAISPAGGIYGFVVGTAPGLTSTDAKGIQYLHLNLSANSYDVFTGCFNPFSPNVIYGSSNECGYYIDTYGGADHGEWAFSPIVAGTGVYEVKIWPQNYLSNPQIIYTITQNDAIMGTPNDCGPSEIGLDHSGFTDGGSFGFAGGSNPLAANALSLVAQQQANKRIELKWTDTDVKTAARYEIERGADVMNLMSLGINIDSKKNSTSPYVFEDAAVKPDLRYYYRIKAIGLDGEYYYSNISEAIISDRSDFENNLAIFPNPASGGHVNVEWTCQETEKVLITVIDLNGKLLLHDEFMSENGMNRLKIYTASWATGMYFISVSGEKKIIGKFLVN